MSKALIVYFSQYGSTAKVAEHIAAGLRLSGYDIKLHNIQDKPEDKAENYDLLGVGLPAFYFRPPFNVLDYVKGLPDLQGKPFFVFVTRGSNVGDAGNIMRHVLSDKKGKDAGYMVFSGANHFLPYLLKGNYFFPGHPTKEGLSLAEEFGRQVARNVSGAQFGKTPYDPPLRNIIYRTARFFTYRFFVRNLTRFFSLKKEKCNSCGVCINTCPKANIRADKNGKPKWGKECLFCFYCDINCPSQAIVSPGRAGVYTWLAQYTCLPFVLMNKQIERTRVILKSGKIEIMQDKTDAG